MMRKLFPEAQFDFPKSVKLIQTLIEQLTSDGDIVLDSFAGSGTTAHAVLNRNKADGGNRKFILVEMEDYADSITAERVRRVILGYGEGKNAVEGTGGSFSYYEPQRITVLDYDFLSTVTEKAGGTVIYADRCSIDDGKLSQMGIVFKKIPRDISRL